MMSEPPIAQMAGEEGLLIIGDTSSRDSVQSYKAHRKRVALLCP